MDFGRLTALGANTHGNLPKQDPRIPDEQPTIKGVGQEHAFQGVSDLFRPTSVLHMMTSLRDKSDSFDKQGGEEDRVGTVMLFGVPIICLYIENKERLCLAQISNTILRDFSYNEIHNRRVALGITCMQCSPSQLEVLRRTGAMPVSSRRCGLITKREAERLVKSFIEEIPPPRLPEDFAFKVSHDCGWGSKGLFIPSRYNSSRAKCIKCLTCDTYFSPNKFIFHYHKVLGGEYKHPDAANFNSWRRHLVLADDKPSESLLHAWEDVKAMFNGGCRKRFSSGSRSSSYMSRPEVNDSPSDSRFQRRSGSPYGMSGCSPYFPQSSRAHSAFSNPMFGRITSYGDFLRSLSMPYNNPWPSKIEVPPTSLSLSPQVSKQDQFGLPVPGFLPLNIPLSTPRVPWPDPHLLSTSSQMPSLPLHVPSSQPCFPEKVELSYNKIHVEPESSTETTKTDESRETAPSPAKKQRMSTPEPDSSIDVEKNDDNNSNVHDIPVTDDNKDVFDAEETTEPEDDTDVVLKENKEDREDTDFEKDVFADDFFDENFDTKNLQTVPIETLRTAVTKAMTQRKNAEKDQKKMQNMLRLKALKELELREEFARQFCSIKENMWAEIEQERTAKGALEEKLKETRELLQRLTRHIPDPVFLPSCK